MDHGKEARRLVSAALDGRKTVEIPTDELCAMAQVHALLALTIAVEGLDLGDLDDDEPRSEDVPYEFTKEGFNETW